ncbi:CNNM domain-containing protein [Cryobacterium sp. PAMC25264]|uniref:CNNM domain-containing protein n=1 Tax=Cryobacterium sp. PAMC25264 TaxID=2861288 RepID=UPI001C628068|nr:CNNM domain-containing protein [Cryobacterium sp. PAMC25264]QYF74447.1 CNNM domain-containing protein [Cryobacterium sp. PAMC25264]
MNEALVVAVVTVLLIALSAFFVIIEFALLGARRHRLEATAATSRSARAALRGVNELTLMLAGAQLGITACTFALGAITKPALDYWLGPIFSAWGMPEWAAGVLAFALSLLIVTFLHLVVGEMAPKSWAIAHPETAARVIGIPSRIFVWPFRPILTWVNSIANKLVAASGVVPVESAAVGGHNAETIRHLVELSARAGTLDSSFQNQLEGAIELETLRLDELVKNKTNPTVVPRDATVADVQRAAARSGHMRILVGDLAAGIPDVIHVRDTLLDPLDAPASQFVRAALALPGETAVYEVLAQMRATSQQLVVVVDDGRFRGIVTLSDVLPRLLPRADGPTAVAVS